MSALPNNTVITINGRESKVRCRESRSHKKEDVKIYTAEMVNIIEELLKGCDTNFKYPSGITTLNTITSWDEKRLDVKRLSNKILELRKVVPKSAILTFRDFNNSKDEWKYGVIKDEEVIIYLQNLKNEILTKITP